MNKHDAFQGLLPVGTKGVDIGLARRCRSFPTPVPATAAAAYSGRATAQVLHLGSVKRGRQGCASFLEPMHVSLAHAWVP